MSVLESPNATLDKAETYFAAGKWRKAANVCEAILHEGADPDAAFLLGRVYTAAGEAKLALDWFEKVIHWQPQNAEAHFSCAEIHQTEENAHAAAQSWLLGLEIDPSFLKGHLGLADALMSLGLSEQAVIAAKQALLVDSESPEVWECIGRAAEMGGDRKEAIAALEKSNTLRLDPVPEDLRRLALLHLAENNVDRGRDLLRRAVELQPRKPGLRFEYAQVLMRDGSNAAALDHLREAVRLRPNFPEALSNMGMILRGNRQYAAAEAAYKKACSQNPKFALPWNNLANLYIELGRLSDAERCYSNAIAAQPDYAEAHTGRAMLRLLEGKFAEGWDEYEWRWSQPGVRSREFTQPLWDGSSLAGRKILIHAEQGAGDTIQFVRYAKLLKSQGASVSVRCQAPLVELIKTMSEVDEVSHEKEHMPAFDVHAPLMSLPRLFATDLSSIPSENPYLSVPEGVVPPDALRKSEGMRVGLVWAGNPKHHNDRNRSIPTELLNGLRSLEGVQLFSLQVGGAPLADLIGTRPVIDLAPVLTSYAVTAACLQHLDLLITVDTSVAHLAGALGRPVWMMVPVCNDWRWLRDRNDSPWYPTMRIFRQNTLGEWKGVLDQIRQELNMKAGKQA
jgi:tetratricopeptide (TPR) repeat protein